MTRLARCLSVWVRFSIGICQDRDPMPVSHDAFMFHGLRIFVCCATILVVLAKGLEYLKDVFQLNLYANCRNFHFTQFCRSEVMTSNRKWWPFVTDWVALAIKPYFWMGGWYWIECASGSWGIISVLNLWCVLQYAYSLFHFYELLVNCKLQTLWIGFNYITLCTFRPQTLTT